MTDQLVIRRPDDWHVHLRDDSDNRLTACLAHTAQTFGRALVMPNLSPPVLTGADVTSYRDSIMKLCRENDLDFQPMMTIKLLPSTTAGMVMAAKAAGAIAGKLYPMGVTTNSEDGWENIKVMWPVFAAMQECDMVLCLHGEEPDEFCMDRESAFVRKALPDIANAFPDLRIVLEHVTTADAVQMVASVLDNVYATITPHHLQLTLDDVVGGSLRPHHFCKPLAKRPGDREQLVQAALHHYKFFLGTDSAPHTRHAKECDHGCAGVYNAPVAMQIVAEVFDQHDALENVEAFTSLRGAEFYRVEPHEETITLVRRPWTVPSEYQANGVKLVPYRAGTELQWDIAR